MHCLKNWASFRSDSRVNTLRMKGWNMTFSHCWVYGMVWYDMVWYSMVWYDMVWYGMLWYGMIWFW